MIVIIVIVSYHRVHRVHQDYEGWEVREAADRCPGHLLAAQLSGLEASDDR